MDRRESVMGFKIRSDERGPFVEADTAQEALEFLRLSKNGHNAQVGKLRYTAEDLPDPAKSVQAVFDAVNERARSFLSALMQHPQGIEGEKFAEENRMESSSFGGVLGGISKNASKNGHSIEEFVISKHEVEGPRRFRFLQPGPLLKQYGDLLEKEES